MTKFIFMKILHKKRHDLSSVTKVLFIPVEAELIFKAVLYRQSLNMSFTHKKEHL